MDRRRGPQLTRRQMLQLAALGASGASASGWFGALAADAASDPRRRKSCILLWMPGGPSQVDTFDPKPGHANGGPFEAIETAAPGIRLAEHLPKLAREANDLAIIRGMNTREGDHGRATYLLRTGYVPQGPVRYPSLGALVANELDDDSAELPGFVSIAPVRAFNPAAFGSGFLGPRCAPLIVGERPAGAAGPDADPARVDDLAPPPGIGRDRASARLGLMSDLAGDFLATRPGVPTWSHRDAYRRAARMMQSSAGKAFELDDEPDALRDAYGRNPFGQGCLLARRLVERGVPFVEVSLSGVDAASMAVAWDTHQQNFDAVERLSGALDAGWATLMTDLRSRGLLEHTMILWMGEFGRTPQINDEAGRDHFPNAWSTVLAGGGIKGGQAIGDTGPDGMEVRDRPVSVPDLFATVLKGLGIDPAGQNLAEGGRPIRLVDLGARPIEEVLA